MRTRSRPRTEREKEEHRRETSRIRKRYAASPPPPPEEGAGVYFMYAPEVGMVKIGVTGRSMKQRLTNINHASPTPVHLVGVIPGAGERIEADLHEHHKEDRERGEWFRLTRSLARSIKRYRMDGIHVNINTAEISGY